MHPLSGDPECCSTDAVTDTPHAAGQGIEGCTRRRTAAMRVSPMPRRG
jgi:hypothetical protein